jgi:hypothetical protein
MTGNRRNDDGVERSSSSRKIRKWGCHDSPFLGSLDSKIQGAESVLKSIFYKAPGRKFAAHGRIFSGHGRKFAAHGRIFSGSERGFSGRSAHRIAQILPSLIERISLAGYVAKGVNLPDMKIARVRSFYSKCRHASASTHVVPT